MSSFLAIDPATGHEFGEIPQTTPEQVAEMAQTAREQLLLNPEWRTPSARASALSRLARRVEQEGGRLAELETRDTGKPLKQAKADVAATVRYLDYYAGSIERLEGRQIPLGPDILDYTVREPWGVCAQIIPWNYPLQVTARCAAPALAAGNAVIVKPSELASVTPLRFAELAEAAGVPRGLIQVATGDATTGVALVGADVDHVTFVGSAGNGAKVAEACARRLIPVELELGGKSPNILLPGSDWDALNQVVHRRYTNHAGQGCGALTRILVPEADVDRFLEGAAAAVESIPVGHPTDPAVVCGPMIRPEARDRVEAAIEAAVARGGEVVAGGGRPQMERGWYTNPTLLAGLAEDDPVCQDELFGPVAVVQTYRDVDDAIRIANNTRYGLNAGIHGPDLTQCLDVAAKLRCGLVSINGGGGFRPDGVFGGFGASGIGREHGEAGIREYLEPQHIQWGL